jgi:hypothetical protein
VDFQNFKLISIKFISNEAFEMDEELDLLVLDALMDDSDLEILMFWRRCLQLRTRNYLTAKAVPDVTQSAWVVLDRMGDDSDFIAATSLDRAAFDSLCLSFARHLQHVTGRYHGNEQGGRPPKLDARGHLALVLHYYTGTLEQKSLCQVFGVPPATCCRMLRHAEIALSLALSEEDDAKIRWPTLEEQAEFASLVNRKNPYVKGRWGFIDGKISQCRNQRQLICRTLIIMAGCMQH